MSAIASSVELDAFFHLLGSAVSDRQLLKLVLSKYRGSEPLKQVQIRPVQLKQQWLLSFTYKYQTNDVTRNLDAADALAEIRSLVANSFSAANLFTTAAEAQLAISVDEAVAALSKSVAAGHWQRLTGHLSAETQQHKLPWQQLIVQQLSQFLALYHQYPERFSVDADSNNHAYHSWLSVVRQDKGLQVLTGTKLTPLFVALPDEPGQLLAQMQPWLDNWCTDEQSRLAYFEALLQGLSGWAGWQAWLDWILRKRMNKGYLRPSRFRSCKDLDLPN